MSDRDEPATVFLGDLPCQEDHVSSGVSPNPAFRGTASQIARNFGAAIGEQAAAEGRHVTDAWQEFETRHGQIRVDNSTWANHISVEYAQPGIWPSPSANSASAYINETLQRLGIADRLLLTEIEDDGNGNWSLHYDEHFQGTRVLMRGLSAYVHQGGAEPPVSSLGFFVPLDPSPDWHPIPLASAEMVARAYADCVERISPRGHPAPGALLAWSWTFYNQSIAYKLAFDLDLAFDEPSAPCEEIVVDTFEGAILPAGGISRLCNLDPYDPTKLTSEGLTLKKNAAAGI